MKDTSVFFVVLAAIALVLVGRASRASRPSDIFAGLFDGGWRLGWPRGVQEEDSIQPWGDPRRSRTPPDHAPGDVAPTVEDIG